tara:strand:- start:56 stop:685 length:630 start_codon:yes stop_codon:yes gene_type:complete
VSTDPVSKCFAPATERNRDPILSVLLAHLPPSGTVLEVSSGTGQHAAHFAAQLPHLWWQPTDVGITNLASIAAWRDEANAPNLLAPKALDVLDTTWWVEQAMLPEPVSAIVNINMVHIVPWSCCEALFLGSFRVLGSGCPLLLYGPFKQGGQHTAPSNSAFDAHLRSQDSRWGVRDVEAVIDTAGESGFEYQTDILMPANNLMLLFRRG